MRAKAIVFKGIKQVEIKEINIPEVGDREILVDVIRSGVSVGTERWALLGMRHEMSFPFVSGYLAVGKVIKTGKNVKDYKEGDIVNFPVSKLPEPYSTNSWMGTHLSKAIINVNLSIDKRWGMPYCVKVNKNVSEKKIEEITLSGLAAVACRGIEMAKPSLGDRCLVVGLGFIGQMVSQILKLKGCYVVGSDIIEERVKMGEKYSCDKSINVKSKNLVEAIRKEENDNFDIIVDTTGNDRVLNEEIHLLKRWGKFIWQGWYPGETKINFQVFHDYLPTIYMPCSFSGDVVNQCIKWIIEEKLIISPLITHSVSYKMAKEMYSKVLESPSEILGIVFNWEEK